LSSCCDFVATPPDSQSGRSTLKDGDFPLRPSQSYKLNREEFFNMLYDSINARGFIQSKIKTNYLH
ncbi:hypothetical protein, partial [Methanothrix sp.]|uniref:hypothetical protein n=1 Tax=Methanothrix sp. TaxID=90426 RepID=UPI002356C743